MNVRFSIPPIAVTLIPALLTAATVAGAQPETVPPPVPPRVESPVAAPPVEDPEQIPLTLDQAVLRAIQENPTIEEAQAAVRRADALVAEVRSFQLPRLDADARVMIQGPIPEFQITIPPEEPGGAPRQETIRFGQPLQRTLTITGSYTPDVFGRLGAQRQAARGTANVARGGLLAVQNELVFAVQNIYLAALRARELIQVQQEAVEAAREQLRVAQAQLAAGTVPEFDVLRARVQVENVRQNLAVAEGNFRRTTATLRRILSLPGDAPLVLAGVQLPPEVEDITVATAQRILLPSPEPLTAAPAVETLEQALSRAFLQRPEVYQAEWARRAADERVRAERRGRLPTFGVAANFFYTPDAVGLAPLRESWSIVAFAAIPIWDAGLARARTRQAEAERDIAHAQLRGIQDQISEDVRRSLADLEEAIDRRRAAEANVDEAREAQRIARVRYEAGLAPPLEVTDAETALVVARANAVNAAYDQLIALATLNRSLGAYAGDALNRLPTLPRS
jgi:outer membrane protein TolC